MKTNFIASISIFIVMHLSSITSIAQVYQKFEKFDNNQRTTWTHSFRFKSNGYVYSANGVGEMTILPPNANVKKTGKKIDIGKNEEMQCGSSINSQPCVFLKKWEKGNKKESIYAMFYDRKENLSAKDAKKLFYIDYNNKKGKSKTYYPKNTLRCVSSDDESKFLIYYTAPYSKKENFKLGCFLGNNNLEKLTHKVIELPFEAEYKAIRYDMIDIKVTNDGEAYILVKYLLDSDGVNFAKKGEWNHKFFFCKITSDGKVKKLKDIQLKEDNLNISSMVFSPGAKKEVIGTAISSKTCLPVFFKYGIGEDNYQKVEYLEIPKGLSGKSTVDENKPFQKNLAFKYKSDDIPSWTYKIRLTKLQNDGSLLVVAEQYTLSSGYHVYGKMLVFSLTSENQIKWFKEINRRKNLYGATQDSAAEYLYDSEFFFTENKGAIYFIYNTEFDREPDAYVGTEKDKLDRMTFVSINLKTGKKINNNSIYIKKNSSGYLPYIEEVQPNNIVFYIDNGGRVILD